MIHSKIRVLIVEDSKLYQFYLKRIIEADELLEVAGTAETAAQALALAQQLKPDVITLDLTLPDSNNFDVLTQLVAHTPIPVIVVTSMPDACQTAIRIGAKDFIEKIQDGSAHSAEQFSLLLRLKLKMQAPRPVHAPRPAAPHPLAPVPPNRRSIIAIGASLGGTETTLEILRELPACMPGMVVVQHMPRGFTAAYAMRLDRCCKLHVKEACSGDFVQPGTVLIAQGGQQLFVRRTPQGYRVRCYAEDGATGFCPSVDVLFESVAAAAGSNAVGILLTGMGHDGAQGMKRLHDTGAYTIGQDRASCAVFGMPAAAQSCGAVDAMLSPPQIVDLLMQRYQL